MPESSKPKPAPLVSICSQIYNQSDWARDMIQSIIDSTWPNWELLIADDGSTDDLAAVVDSFHDSRLQYFRFDENRGIPFATNEVLKKARGKYVCLLAADETITKEKLAEQVEYLESYPGVDAVWGLPGSGNDAPKGGWPMGHRPEYEQYGLRAHNRSRYAWLRTLLQRDNVPIGSCSMMMKKSVMDELGGMDEKLTVFADHELYCRFFEKYTGVVLPFRWAIDKPMTGHSVRSSNAQRAQKELEYVLGKHRIPVPPTSGKVTVGIPCYNHARFLADAVASVLAQTHAVDEILILDDGSTDDFREVVRQFRDPRIRILAFDENRGMQEAQNQMAFRAAGEFFVPLSADDMLKPDFVSMCLDEFAKNPWLEFVASQVEFVTEDKKPFTTPDNPMLRIPQAVNRSREDWLSALHPGNHYFGAGMYRTYAISEVAGWEKEYKVISDYQMYLKLLQREPIRIIEKPLTIVRVHGKNDSLLSAKQAKELPWLYHAARKRFYPKARKIMIATPFYELKGFSPYIESLAATLRLLTGLGIDHHFQQISGDSYVHRVRNTFCDLFLRDPDMTDLFFIDSDMSWNPEAFIKMCLLRDDVVGAAYPVKNKWDAWTSIPKFHQENGQMVLKGRELPNGTGLIEAQVLAAGFLRIKRHVLERFRERYPDLWYEEPTTDPNEPNHRYTAFFGAESVDHQFFGEDHLFSKRLREMDVRLFIYSDVDIIHWGYKDFGGNFDKFLKNEKFKRETEQTAAANA